MPKSQYIDPSERRKAGFIKFQDIPVNQYSKSIEDEKANFSNEDFIRIYRDMAIIREFETMLNLIKTTSEYNGIPYSHPGPAHLSIGQEASAVGQAYILTKDDYTFGSHRGHGEVIAKALSCIEKLSDQELLDIMKETRGGSTLKVVESNGKYASVKDMARAFVLYGFLAEMFARETGFSRGLGGSMHAFFIPFGIYPNNAIVGGSADIAMGAALYKRVNCKDGMVIANIGDASLGCGPVWEAINMAAMDQYTQLWDEAHKGGLPIIFNFFNNQYGMGGQTCGETMAYNILARFGAGVNPDQMHSERVDGFNPLAVIDAYKRKRAIIDERRGPVLLDVLTYRYSGHSPSDASSYRTKEELAAWQEVDPLITYRAELVKAGVASEDAFEAILENVKKEMTEVVKLAVDPQVSPYMDLVAQPNAIADIMFSNGHVESLDTTRKPDVLIPYEENPRVQKIAKKERFGFKDGKPVSKNKVYQYRDGIFEALINKFYEDPTLIAYGEENRDWGGAFAVYGGLTESLPYHRLFNSPISEAAIVGSAVGYGLCGGRSVVELMYCDFLGRAGDEVFNQMAKWQAMTAGELKVPMILRVSVGSKYGAQHSQDWSALIAHIPGLKACFPATPYDAKGLMTTALNGTDPVVFFESQRIYDYSEQFHEGGVPAESYEIPFGEPDIKRAGSDVTILTIGAVLYRAMDAAKELQEKYNISAEVIDARSLVPFNYEKVLESVKKTGKLVIVGDACERASIMKEMAANVTNMAFDYLDAPVVVVGAKNWITPAYELDNFFFPQPSWIIDAIHEKIMPIPGYVAKANYTTKALLDNNKKGV